MMYEKNSWVWVQASNNRLLAFVYAVREHTVTVRFYDEEGKRLKGCLEVITKRFLSPTDFDWEQLSKLPCGKRPLSLNRSKMIVAVNLIFKDNERRQERRVYYCRRCKDFHTTAQFKLPVEFLKKLVANPYRNDEPENYYRIFYRKRIWHWWYYNLDVKISYRLFERIIAEYDPDPASAILRIKADPVAFMHFITRFMYNRRHKTGS